jgi:type I restriction enzyme M protein
MVTRKLRAFSDDDIERISKVYHQWRNIKGKYKNEDGFCYAASIEEVKAQNGILSPGRYVGTEEEDDDGIPFEIRMSELVSILEKQFIISNELQKSIRLNIKSFLK